MKAEHLDRASSRRAGVCAALACLLAGALLLASPAGAAAACPNEAIREAQGAQVMELPDCMALEMVSPPKKGAQHAKFAQVSADGERVRFFSTGALGETPGVLDAIIGDSYIASRTAQGWQTASTTPPIGMTKGWEVFARAQSFTPDFSGWFQIAATLPQEQVGISRAFRGGLGGVFEPLSPLLVPLAAGEQESVLRSVFRGASADHSHLYFQPGNVGGSGNESLTAYLPGDPEPPFTFGGVGDLNTYVARLGSGGEPALELLARDRFGKAWGGNCGTRLGGIRPRKSVADESGNGERNQGAVSADGSRTYFSTRPSQPETGECDSAANKLRIMVREESGAGPEIEELFSSECSRISPPCSSADGDDLYQGASEDGARVYFMSPRQLSDSDLDEGTECSAKIAESQGCDLYLYDSTLPAGERLIQVSAGEDVPGEHETGKGAGALKGTTAISTDGSHVYFVAQGVLTSGPNPAGDTAIAGQPNLYVWDRVSEETAFIGTLDPGDKETLWDSRSGTFHDSAYPVPATAKDAEGNQIGADGHVLLFVSKAPLSADDEDGAHSDVFRYDADAGTLQRVSEAPPGGADNGASDVEVKGADSAVGTGTDFAEVGRWASEDGETVAFQTEEGLLPGDENGSPDFYLWRAGQLYRLPGVAYYRKIAGAENNPALSHDGTEVAFQTLSQLLPQDGDSSSDIYVARAGGGYPIPPAARICAGEECQGPAGAPPAAPGAASAAFTGPGNVKPKGRKGCPKGRRQVKRKGKVRCVKAHRKHRRQHKKAEQSRDANANRRAAK